MQSDKRALDLLGATLGASRRMPSWHSHLNVDRHICCMRTQVLREVLPAVPDTDWYADMAADDVCASCAADAGV
jgi:hypothetical protein